jgi:ribose 5-phosphate isomerase
VTDNGNFIIDAPFDREVMKEPFKVLKHEASSTFS